MTFTTEIASLVMIGVLSLVAVSSADAQARPDQTRRATLSVADATRIALEQFPGGEVLELERDYERGREVFEIEVRDRDRVKHDLVLDATDGSVVRNVVDDD